MPGFDNNVVYAKNVDFTGESPVTETMTIDGQLLIGTTSLTPGGTHIKVGQITSPNATILVGYDGTDITLDTGAQAAVSFQTDSGVATVIGNVLNVLGAGGNVTSGSGNTILITGGGGGGGSTSLAMQTGTSPVVPLAGVITLSGGVVAAGTNPIRSNGTGANTATIQVQRSQAIAAADATKVGVSNFNSFQFAVDSTGFVTLAGGMAPPTLFLKGDDLVNVGPDVLGAINLTGNVVANATHAKAVYVVNNAVNSERIDIQLADDIASTDVTKVGLAAFDSADFTVDANGFVSLASSIPTTDLHTARYIVSAGGTADGANYTSLTTAYADAVTASAGGTIPQTVFLQPGTYTTNLTLSPLVNLAAYNCDAQTPNVIISGKLSYSSAGTVSISGIRLQTNGDYFLSVTGSAASIVNLNNCYLNALNNTGIQYTSSSSSSRINVNDVNGNLGTTGIGMWTMSSTGIMRFQNHNFTNSGGSTTYSNNSNGGVILYYGKCTFPVSTSSTGAMSARYVRHEIFTNTTAFLFNGTGTITEDGDNSALTYGEIDCGSAIAVTIGSGVTGGLYYCTISSGGVTAVSGAGTLIYCALSFIFNGTMTVSTQTPVPFGPRISMSPLTGLVQPQIMSGTGSPNGVVTAPKGSIFMRTDGSSSSTRAYSNTNGGSAWTNFTTAA